MKKIDYMLATASMLLLIIAVLITSFQWAIYGDPQYQFYEKEYEKYEVADSLGMEMEDIMEVTDHMMAYLIGKEDKLSVTTEVEGKMQDFFNEQDRLHMADVKNLFLGGLKLRTILLCVAAALIILLLLRKARLGRLLPRAYGWSLGVFLMIILLLAISFAIDFTKCFTIFHQLFFTNDLWLFDPDTDYMIRMLPEGFFSDMTLRIGMIFIGNLLLLALFIFGGSRIQKKIYKNKLSNS